MDFKIQKFLSSNSAVYLLIWVAGFALYFKSLFFGFSYLDDNVLVLNNLSFLQNILNVFPAFVTEVFHILHSSAAYYRPLLTISFMPEAMISGASPFFYHFINIAIHLVAACLVFKLLSKLKYSKTVSLILSVVFLVHPALTQAVSWIPGRNDSLLAVFAIACFIYFLDFLETEKFSSAVLTSIFYLLALFTKESAVMLPVACLIYVWFFSKEKIKNVLKDVLPGWIIFSLVWFFLRYIALFHDPLVISAKNAILGTFANLPGALQLLGKVFFPVNLSVLPIEQDTTLLWGILAFVVIFIFFIFQISGKTKSKKSLLMMFFGLIWFVLFLLPALLRIDTSDAADFIEHRLYVPIIGLLIFLAESNIWKILETKYKKIFLATCFLIIFLFIGVNFNYQNNFYSKISFWKDAAKNSPHSALAQKNLGAMYYLDGKLDLAKIYYNKALALNSAEPMVYNNLGLVDFNKGLYKDAEQEYLKEISINPYYDDVYFNLGLLYYKTGKIDKAKQEFQKTLQINPDYPNAKNILESL